MEGSVVDLPEVGSLIGFNSVAIWKQREECISRMIADS